MILSAQPGDVLIIENPEAHIHPAGQISLGRLMATAAAHGVQVIVETHSDHVFNGMRLYIREFPKYHPLFKFYFVDRELTKAGFESVPKEATVSAQGKFTSAPNGFFDAWEKALFELVSP
jgi:predicted ATPase